MTEETLYRYRLTFAEGDAIKYISHLDLVRAWERALRRADVALAYSHGFSPHARLFFANALSVGVTGRAEMVDIVLERPIEPGELAHRLKAQLPLGLALTGVEQVALDLPSLPAQVVAAEYEVCVESAESPAELQARLDSLLAASELPRRLQREDKVRDYDLRPLIQALRVLGRREGMYVLGMRLQADGHGTGRPDEVLSALGLSEVTRGITRTRLVLQSMEVG
jgi:radical SAM-linked protein